MSARYKGCIGSTSYDWIKEYNGLLENVLSGAGNTSRRVGNNTVMEDERNDVIPSGVTI